MYSGLYMNRDGVEEMGNELDWGTGEVFQGWRQWNNAKGKVKWLQHGTIGSLQGLIGDMAREREEGIVDNGAVMKPEKSGYVVEGLESKLQD